MPGRCGTRIWRPGAEPSSAPGRLSEVTSDPQSLPLRERRPMPELIILNVPQDVLSRMRRLANKGDEEAQRWLKVATRYDRLASNFLAAVCLAATLCYWL